MSHDVCVLPSYTHWWAFSRAEYSACEVSYIYRNRKIFRWDLLVIQNFKVWKVFKYAAYILTIRDGKKHPKLHKYTLGLYIYAVLEYWISEGEQGVIWWEAQIFPIKIRHWWIEYISNWNRKNLEWHPNRCNFVLRKRSLCILMFVTLHLDGCFFAWLPPLICLESKSSMFFFLILNELHSVAENFTFLTKINYIPYENTLHSLPEYTPFS